MTGQEPLRKLQGIALRNSRNSARKMWVEHIHPEDREKVLTKCRGVLKERGTGFKQEFRFRRKDGSYFYVEDSGVILRERKRTDLLGSSG